MIDNVISILGFILRQKKIPNIFVPLTLTEKILKIKITKKAKNAGLRVLVSDRLKVREYVKEKSPQCCLIPILWSGYNFTIDVWNSLPNKFVIKANHGSKMVLIVDKSLHDFSEVLKLTEKWKKEDYYKKGREWVYKDLERILIVEEFINFKNDVPPDYKFFCLNGIPSFVQVDLDRYQGHCRNIYSMDFKLLDVKYQFSRGYDIDKPLLFNQAIEIAKELSIDFDFIRVDLYILDDQIYFGEMTNFPGNCLEGFEPIDFDFKMGQKLNISED